MYPPLTTILVIVLILLLIGGLPQTNLHRYGYGPSGVLGVILIVLVIFILLGLV